MGPYREGTSGSHRIARSMVSPPWPFEGVTGCIEYDPTLGYYLSSKTSDPNFVEPLDEMPGRVRVVDGRIPSPGCFLSSAAVIISHPVPVVRHNGSRLDGRATTRTES